MFEEKKGGMAAAGGDEDYLGGTPVICRAVGAERA